MATPIRVVFMGTPQFAVKPLQALHDDKRFSVELVITRPDQRKGRGRKFSPPPVKEMAQNLGLPYIQPVKAKDDECIKKLTEIAPDFLVVVAYGQILPLSILNIPRIAPVNLHASLLPRWRGAAPIERAFIEGDKSTGVCVMLMEEGLDTGDVLLCEETPITDDDTGQTLRDRMSDIGAKLLVKALHAHSEGVLTPQKQDDEKATYAKKLTSTDYKVDWSLPAPKVSCQIRALSPSPGSVTTLSGKKLKPLFCKVTQGEGEPGKVLSVTKEGITIACMENAVLVTELKPEGKKAMSAWAYTLGHKVLTGDCFA